MRRPGFLLIARCAALGCLWALPATSGAADELTGLLGAGRIVRVEHNEAGRFKQGLCGADIAAPLGLVWDIINAQEKYPEFMPRVKKLTVKLEAPNVKLISYVLDTPFSDTTYS